MKNSNEKKYRNFVQFCIFLIAFVFAFPILPVVGLMHLVAFIQQRQSLAVLESRQLATSETYPDSKTPMAQTATVRRMIN